MQRENIIIKKDTSINWNKAINFIPKDGELIMYTDYSPNKIKIGDGITKLSELPFVADYTYTLNDDVLIIN